jgi:hypothetical protein
MMILSKRLVISGLLLVLLVAACTKKPEQIGANLQPDQDRIQVLHTDTIAINAYSVLEDSIRTDEPSQILLGSIVDPTFGKTVASFYTQLRLSTNAPDFGANPVLDSLVLQLAYSGYYGDTTTLQTIRVQELVNDIYLDSSYFSNQHIARDPFDYANKPFYFRPESPFPLDGDTLPALIRIRLSDQSPALGNKILSTPAEFLASSETFTEYMKGIYVTVDAVSSNGAIAYLNLPSNLSRATIYYHNDSEDSLRYELTILANTPRFNHFEHFNYADASPEFKGQLLQGDTSLGQEKLYLQAMGGLRTYIGFPNLKHFARNTGKKIVVNEARLIFSGYEEEPEFIPPNKLALVKRTGNMQQYTIMEDQLDGETYFDGNYKASLNEYHFRITRYVQNLISLDGEDDDFGLYALIIGASSKADRWVFNGANPQQQAGQKPFKLQIVYSTVD